MATIKLNDEFLLACFEYEKRKKKCHRKAYKNICQMSLSKCIKPLRKTGKPSKTAGPSSANSGTDESRDVILVGTTSKRKLSPAKSTPEKEVQINNPEDDDNLMDLSKNSNDEMVDTVRYGSLVDYFQCGSQHQGKLLERMKRQAVMKNAFLLVDSADIMRYSNKHFFDDVKVTIDYGKIQLILKSFSKDAKFEFWQGEGGCWIWNKDDVRFAEGPTYETMAAVEFQHVIDSQDDKVKWKVMNFDIGDPESYHPKEHHRTYFSQKITKWREAAKGAEIEAKEFILKVYLGCDQPPPIFDLKFFESEKMETIRFRVWDDGHLPLRNRRAVPEWKKMLDSTTYLNAKVLDLQDVHFRLSDEYKFVSFEHVYLLDLDKNPNDIDSTIGEFEHILWIAKSQLSQQFDSVDHPVIIHVTTPLPLAQIDNNMRNDDMVAVIETNVYEMLIVSSFIVLDLRTEKQIKITRSDESLKTSNSHL